MTFKKENKYLVLKWKDINQYLSNAERDGLRRIVTRISIKRQDDGKRNNSYIVVNEEEPYSSLVWELVRTEVENPGKNSNLYNGLLNELKTLR